MIPIATSPSLSEARLAASANEVFWLLIANPQNRRAHQFQHRLREQGCRHSALLAYHSLLDDLPALAQTLSRSLKQAGARRVLVRIDSPGEDFNVEQRLIALGAAQDDSRLTPRQALALPFEQGRIRYLKEWYRGFVYFLDRLQTHIRAAAQTQGLHVHFMNAPQDIACMFDKPACQQRLSAHGVNIPPTLPTLPHYEALREHMLAQRCYRVFIKPAHGSSASGVIAYQIKPDGRQHRADTSVELVLKAGTAGLYNSLRPQTYRNTQHIDALINSVMAEGAHIEHWIPKSQIDGLRYDLRMMVIDGQIAQGIARKSAGALTNLHLGNARVALSDIPQSETIMPAVQMAARGAAAAFANTLYAGIDIVVARHSRRPYVLEMNAFGDLLPGITHRGCDTYTSEIRACLGHCALT